MNMQSFSAASSDPPLPLWERYRPPSAAVSSKNAEAGLRLCRIGRSDPREGLRHRDSRREPLTPTLSHRSRMYPTSTIKMPNSGKPELGGRGGALPLLQHLDSYSQKRTSAFGTK